MKKQVSINLAVLIALITVVSFPASAQMKSPTELKQQEKLNSNNAPNPLLPQNSSSPENNVLPEKQLIPVSITKNPTTGKVEAKISELKLQALEMGIDQMVMEGVQEVKELPDGSKDISVTWTGAYRIDPKTNKKLTTTITIPLNSKIIAKPQLDIGDKFNAEGNSLELISAWRRLNTDTNPTEEPKKEEKETKDNNETSAKSAGGVAEDKTLPKIDTPTFTATPADVVVQTTDGCPVKVDKTQMVAIVQEKTLTNGVESAPCDDTLTRYPIEKVTKASCGLIFDTPNLLAYEQYILRYTDPNAGDVQVQDCTQDNDKTITLIATTNGCGLSHDFIAGLSHEQEQLTYFYNGATQILQACANNTVTFSHIKTENGCTPTIVGSDVILSFATTINHNGTIETINPCTPDPTSAIAVQNEVCASPRYTHDFTGGQSFLNKNYFYTKNGSRIDISTCQQSTTTFPHLQDETVCTATNDDTTMQTTMFAKTYIEEVAGTKVYITSCNSISPTIPYSVNGNKWKIATSTNATINLTPTDLTVTTTPTGGFSDGWVTAGWNPTPFNYISSPATCYAFNSKFGKMPCFGQTGNTSAGATPSGQNYCINNILTGNWTSAGTLISQINSTTSPTWTFAYSGAVWAIDGTRNGVPLRLFYASSNQTVTATCSQPTCLLTHLKAHPAYLRGDGSNYLDVNTTIDNLYVCGDGSNKDGQVYP